MPTACTITRYHATLFTFIPLLLLSSQSFYSFNALRVVYYFHRIRVLVAFARPSTQQYFETSKFGNLQKYVEIWIQNKIRAQIAIFIFFSMFKFPLITLKPD